MVARTRSPRSRRCSRVSFLSFEKFRVGRLDCGFLLRFRERTEVSTRACFSPAKRFFDEPDLLFRCLLTIRDNLPPVQLLVGDHYGFRVAKRSSRFCQRTTAFSKP